MPKHASKHSSIKLDCMQTWFLVIYYSKAPGKPRQSVQRPRPTLSLFHSVALVCEGVPSHPNATEWSESQSSIGPM